MEDNYTSFKVHSNYYAGILDVIEDLPEAEKNSILAEYFLAFHEYGNTRKIPEFKNKIAQGFFNAILYSVDKSFEKNDNYQASQDIGSVGGKQKAINAKIRAAEKKLQESEKKLEELEALAEQAEKAEQALAKINGKNTEKDGKTVDNKGISSGHNTNQALAEMKLKNIEKNDKSLDNKGISSGQTKKQTVSSSHQLDWQCVAGLELTEHQKQEAIRIRKANNTTKKTKTFTQASLKQFLTQVKYSVDAGISIDEVLEVWEGKQWVTWTHAYHAKERPSNAKPQGINGSQENISFAQSDAVDKSFDKLKSDINFLADNSDAPEGHTEEFTIEDLREIVTKEIQDRQYNKQQQQVLFNKLQAFLISKYPDLARQVKPQQINADIKQIGAVNG